jgi:hypothetical protein
MNESSEGFVDGAPFEATGVLIWRPCVGYRSPLRLRCEGGGEHELRCRGALFEGLEAAVGRAVTVRGRARVSAASAAPEGSEAASRFVTAPGESPMIPAMRAVEVLNFELQPPADAG